MPLSTPQTANVYITNNTGGNAAIQMTHQYFDRPLDMGSWQAAPGQTVGPLVVHFETGPRASLIDGWWCTIQVKDGPHPGNYASVGPRKQCMLASADAGKDITNTVDTSTFKINLLSGGCSAGMWRLNDYSPITNVFVLMLENHSFDHLLGFSGITGKDQQGNATAINGLTGTESNSIPGAPPFVVQKGAFDPMTTDPGHEFLDTLEQLCGPGVSNPFPNKPYPKIDCSGFVSNYTKPKVDEGKTFPPPTSDHYKDIMACATPDQIPVLYKLAKNYAVCDSWHSSMPGPTWPNRFFATCGTAGGLDVSPSRSQVKTFETTSGFRARNGKDYGTIFDLLTVKGLKWHIYNDSSDLFNTDRWNSGNLRNGGAWAIASGLQNIRQWGPMVQRFEFLPQALIKQPYVTHFTWIEPNYGDAGSGSYRGGSSQHPTDSLLAGEKLIAATYNAIRNSPVWPTSLLIITYDEHGGYYDHVHPPTNVTPPRDYDQGLNVNGFDFSVLGVRVPAVIVSPQIANLIDHTLYDHTTILKTVEDLFGLPNLTQRDLNANSLRQLITGIPRADCIGPVDMPAGPPQAARQISQEEMDANDAAPLPESGNLHGFLQMAAAAELELSGGGEEAKNAIAFKLQSIKTQGDAKLYMGSVAQKMEVAKAKEEEEQEAV